MTGSPPVGLNGDVTIGLSPPNYNTEVIKILLDIDDQSLGPVNAVNFGHARNPRNLITFHGKPASDSTLPGVRPDYVYRDPWANPYVITMDLNDDNKCTDLWYGTQQVSQDAAGAGLNGLIGFGSQSPLYEATRPNMHLRY